MTGGSATLATLVPAPANSEVPSEADAAFLFEAMPLLGWVADAQGIVTHYNRRWYEYTGTTSEEMAGLGRQSVYRPEDLPEIQARWRTALATGEPFEKTVAIRGKDGVFRWFLTRAVPIRDEHGNVRRWIGINTDIDDRKRAEAALEDAVRLREDLLAMVSHDLRNPMNSTLMAASHIEQLARDRDSADRILRATAIIHRSVDQMNKLVNQLLDLSRLEAKQPLAMEMDYADVAKTAVQVFESMEPVLRSKQIGFTLDLPERSLFTTCDTDRMRQVLENLIGNAAKFTRAGGSVRVSVRREGASVVIEVIDTGTGIAPTELPNVFSAYWQGDGHKKRGVGLGLAIVKAIATAHHGTIAVRSELGKGTTFRFAIPLTDANGNQRSE